MYLRESRGFDFTVYQHARLRRQLDKRLQALHFERILDYWQYLEEHPDEFDRLLNGLLIQATAFFRDRDAWTYLSEQIIPQLAAATGAASSLRIWNAGCASGEETYTLAMVLAEVLGLATFQRRVRIFATDIDERALERGRHGNYSATMLRSVPAGLKETYFQPVGGRYAVRSDIRHNIIFGRHDLTQDPPLARLNLLVCRNTLMFFSIETQHRILRRFSFALQNEGILFLGKAETPLFQGRVLLPIHPQHRVFMKMPNAGDQAPRHQSDV
jgi:two-component system CheB/CheR fusion protein